MAVAVKGGGNVIDEKALLEKVKKVQQILIAEDYDEILSYLDLERLIAELLKEQKKPG